MPAAVARLQSHRPARNPFLRALTSSSPSRDSEEAIETLLDKHEVCQQAESIRTHSREGNRPQGQSVAAQSLEFSFECLPISGRLPQFRGEGSPITGLGFPNRQRPPPVLSF